VWTAQVSVGVKQDYLQMHKPQNLKQKGQGQARQAEPRQQQ